jgi:hypothetical protein
VRPRVYRKYIVASERFAVQHDHTERNAWRRRNLSRRIHLPIGFIINKTIPLQLAVVSLWPRINICFYGSAMLLFMPNGLLCMSGTIVDIIEP